MNLIVGTSKTVHNAQASVLRDGVWVAVPTCAVRTWDKTLTPTDAPVTCKTCAKHG